MPRRRGLNCSLSYPYQGRTRMYRVRSNMLTWGYQMIASESQARDRKAFYPRKTAPTQFALGVELVGYRERQSLNNWLMAYVAYILDPSLPRKRTPQMTVTLPNRNFKRVGVPISGIEYGDNLGLMVKTPQIVFETSGEPLDWDDPYNISRVYAEMAKEQSPETEYFYPTGTQLNGSEIPASGSYTRVMQDAVNGGGKPKKPELDLDEASNFVPVAGPAIGLLDDLADLAEGEG